VIAAANSFKTARAVAGTAEPMLDIVGGNESRVTRVTRTVRDDDEVHDAVDQFARECRSVGAVMASGLPAYVARRNGEWRAPPRAIAPMQVGS